jgi:hypothetical protein
MAIIATLSVSILTPQANAEFEEEQNIAVTGALVPHGGFIVPVGLVFVQFGETGSRKSATVSPNGSWQRTGTVPRNALLRA